MMPLITNHMYNLEKISFHRIKVDNIFTVENLISALEKFLLIKDLELDECCSRFTDKFFSHFANKKSNLRFI
jgi:hypothetical protein